MNKLLFSIVVAIIFVGCDKPAMSEEEEILSKMIHHVRDKLQNLGFAIDLSDISINVETPRDMAFIFNHLNERSKTSMSSQASEQTNNDGVSSRLAFYDPNSKSIIIRQGVAQTISEGYLAHELAHVYQDQKWGFSEIWSPFRDDPSPEQFSITQFMIEGYAELVRQAYEQDQEKGTDTASNLSVTLGKIVENDCLVCESEKVSSDLPYSMGLRFLAHQYRQGGWPLVEEMIADLPDSTEQLLHPAKYEVDRASTFSMPTLEDKGFSLVSEEMLGEAGLLTKLLTLSVPAEIALKAASGWDGDKSQIYEANGQELSVWRIVFDRVIDAQQLEATLKSHTKMGDVFRVGRMVDWIESKNQAFKKQARIFFSKNLLDIKSNSEDESSTLEQEKALDADANLFNNPYLSPKIFVGPKT